VITERYVAHAGVRAYGGADRFVTARHAAHRRSVRGTLRRLAGHQTDRSAGRGASAATNRRRSVDADDAALRDDADASADREHFLELDEI